MKKSKIIRFLSVMLCVSLLTVSLSACKKSSGKTSRTTEEETEEETTEATTKATVPVPSMKVDSLDQFISDGSLYAEDVVLPTPTPIPVQQTPLGLENDGNGYYSGSLENVNVIDTKNFRYTITKIEHDDEHYYVYGEFENKTDYTYSLHFKNPTVDNECNSFYFTLDEPIQPHTTVPDLTDFAKCVKDYHGQEFTRISFLLLAIDSLKVGKTMPISETGNNYILVNLFPQGEDKYVYEESPLPEGADIVVDTEGTLLSIDSFELLGTDPGRIYIHYTIRNKTADYIQFKLKDESMMFDDTVFDGLGHQSTYVAPFTTISDYFSISLENFDKVKIDPHNVKSLSLPVIVNSLTDDIKVMWERIIKVEVGFD